MNKYTLKQISIILIVVGLSLSVIAFGLCQFDVNKLLDNKGHQEWYRFGIMTKD